MSVRRRALEALTDVTDKGAYANLRLKAALEGLPERDARWASALVYTALDKLRSIDAVIEKHAKGKLNPTIRGILRLGVCQLLFMDVPDNAACDESVKLAREVGKGALSGYVNAVMRSVCRDKEVPLSATLGTAERLSLTHSFPLFLVKEYISLYGEAFTEEMLSFRGGGMTLRAQYPYEEEDLERELQARNAPFTRGAVVPSAFRLKKGFDVTKDALFLEGKTAVQSEGAMLACLALDLKEGQTALDACAAPGGKTAYMSALLRGTGHILSWELHPHRAALTEKTFERLHVKNASVAVRDASVLEETLFQKANAVLVDAPCSGLGLWGKPDAKLKKDEEAVAGLAELQHRILDTCARYVRPGGVLVYSTCTVSHAENEAQSERFLKEHPEFFPSSLAPYVPMALRERAKGGMLQIFPHLDGAEGFFTARFLRHGG